MVFRCFDSWIEKKKTSQIAFDEYTKIAKPVEIKWNNESERVINATYNFMNYMVSKHLCSTVVARYQLGNVYRNGYYPYLLQPGDFGVLLLLGNPASECFVGEERFVNKATA
jgi:hypothetical protein